MTNYKLVPLEPTDEMIDAARDQHEGEPYLPASLYKAMLAAAPDVAGLVEALQTECEELRKAVRRLCNLYVVDDYYFGDMREVELSRAVEWAISAHRQQQEGEP